MIAGGSLGTSNVEVYEQFIDLAGGDKDAKIGIVPAASGSLKSSIQFKEDLIFLRSREILNRNSAVIIP